MNEDAVRIAISPGESAGAFVRVGALHVHVRPQAAGVAIACYPSDAMGRANLASAPIAVTTVPADRGGTAAGLTSGELVQAMGFDVAVLSRDVAACAGSRLFTDPGRFFGDPTLQGAPAAAETFESPACAGVTRPPSTPD